MLLVIQINDYIHITTESLIPKHHHSRLSSTPRIEYPARYWQPGRSYTAACSKIVILTPGEISIDHVIGDRCDIGLDGIEIIQKLRNVFHRAKHLIFIIVMPAVDHIPHTRKPTLPLSLQSSQVH